MKKGFTMIELIFVIVILGILAAVAIPRLAATRDDAQVTTAAADIATLYKDLGSYYTAQGSFDGNVSVALTSAAVKNMTNVANAYPTATAGEIQFRTDSNATQCIVLTLTADGNVSATKPGTSTVCTQALAIPGIAAVVDNNQSFGGRKITR